MSKKPIIVFEGIEGSGKSHILTKKETKHKRNLTQTGLVHESDVKNIKQQLCL